MQLYLRTEIERGRGEGRGGERKEGIKPHQLVHLLNADNSRDWTRPKPGLQVGGRGLQTQLSYPCHLPKCTLAGC